uniref:Uncharacterized protein n=1 Tax=Physcomitrium patens TaxID=3218 RepID=A0A2K1IM87_PHYPA|nr:hypothetical protein PHYPA_026699 [Physcomitrium patens]
MSGTWGILDLASLRPATGRRVAEWARESLAAVYIAEEHDAWGFCAEQRAVSGPGAAEGVVLAAFEARAAGCSQAAAVNYLRVAMRHVRSTREIGVEDGEIQVGVEVIAIPKMNDRTS